jgi:hypothetical protein
MAVFTQTIFMGIEEMSEPGQSKFNRNDPASNKQKQDIDKAPGEGRGKGEKVTSKDLKGKKIDADPSQEKDRPAK